MYLFLLLGLAIGFGLGFVVSARRGGGALVIPGSDEAEEFSQAGHRAVSERIEKRKDRIMEKARTEGHITNDGVEDLFCIGNSTASNYLAELVKEGRLTRLGKGRGTYYEPRGE